MTVDLIKFGFVAGEVAPSYYGRADLEKFDLALAEAENWFVDYHGGLSNVQGTHFVDFVQYDTFPVKCFPFRFSDTVANKYVILLGKNYIRFIQDGAYVLESAFAVTAVTKGSTTLITIPGHNFVNDEWIQVLTTGEMTELVNRTCQVEVVSSTQIYLRDTFGNHIDSTAFTTYISGMTVARIYTLTHAYLTSDISDIKAHQIRDVVRLTHKDYVTLNLKRIDNANWTLVAEDFTNTVPRTNITSYFSAGTGSYYCPAYVVTVVDTSGRESLQSDFEFTNTLPNVDGDSTASCTIRFTEVTGAAYYNIYRTRMNYMTNVNNPATWNTNRGFQVGYIGQSPGATFTDTGITPDFTRTPPRNVNPLAKGAIRYIDVLTSGSFARDVTMTVTDATGSGFIGYPIVHVGNNVNTGAIVGFLILDGGKNYTNPTITISAAGTFTYAVDLSDSTGLDPSVSTVYQQRQIYAGSENNPLTIYGSKPGNLSDFSESSILVASDSFAHEIDSEDFSPIRHAIPTRGGLLLMSSGGIWLMSGSSGNAITATDVQADLNVFTGVSKVDPLKIDTDILYTTATGGRVNSLAYADNYKLYAPTDVSILANHLISKNKIIRWTYADEPHRLIYAVRDDGVMLLFTMIKDQEVYAWTRRVTRGQYLDVVSFDGEGDSDVYFVVRRKINGQYRKVIERLADRAFDTHEDVMFLDCALSLTKTYPEYNLDVMEATGADVNVIADGAVFDSTSVGKILRFGNGKARVTSVNDPTSAQVKIIRDFDLLLHYDNVPRQAMAGEWTLDAEVSTVSGLYHLEGLIVTVVADGTVIKNVTVTGGSITLPQPASRVSVGIPYKSVARNLPLNMPSAIIENKRKRIPSLAMRLLDTKGLRVGNNLDELYSPRTASSAVLGDAGPLYSGITHLMVEPIWSDEGQNYFVQENPLPVTILGYILDADIGDS